MTNKWKPQKWRIQFIKTIPPWTTTITTTATMKDPWIIKILVKHFEYNNEILINKQHSTAQHNTTQYNSIQFKYKQYNRIEWNGKKNVPGHLVWIHESINPLTPAAAAVTAIHGTLVFVSVLKFSFHFPRPTARVSNSHWRQKLFRVIGYKKKKKNKTEKKTKIKEKLNEMNIWYHEI